MSVFCLHRFALSTNPRIIPAEISRYRLLSMSVSLISRQPMKLQISFGFARAMPTTNPQTGMLWERDCSNTKPQPTITLQDITLISSYQNLKQTRAKGPSITER